MNFGVLILDSGSCILGFGFWSLDFSFFYYFGIFISESAVFSAVFNFWILDLGLWILVLDFGFSILVTVCYCC